ncbi:hypothetical protein BN59_03418 [Legionella massiliensis]|uniref:Endonuclease/Exonuclease/phosphatase family protein n=1 Tax=Legionella massiliensis TaxID=1034943 RepID=A0A078L1K9_9GAMM|nr:hypothetical protein [Legionella massiliensis]CDZ79101.1 hypothetical protein BN59_03418 [Legionella massiliensis]CEE14839.1 hypothetical protein BN1094_03418 [Legionella massiliensis]
MPRKHPLFPEHYETALDSSLAYSDHLPILVSVPLGEGIEPLNIISLNIAGLNSSGLNSSGVHARNFSESEPESNARFERIAAGLAAAAATQNASVILLQETSYRMQAFLERALDENYWKIFVDRAGIISLYRRDRLILQKTKADEQTRIRSMTFELPSSNKTVDVHNIWGSHDPYPNYMERLFSDTLTDTKSDISVIVGDSNTRIAPFDDRKRNITTAIIQPVFNVYDGLPTNLQRSDYRDGGFYRDASGVIKQLETYALDFVTGEVVVDERSAAEIDLWPEYRMVMCLDDSYSELKVIDGFTLFEYEEELKADLNDPSLLVRMAADSFNNKAVAIRFPLDSQVYNAVRETLGEEEWFQFRRADRWGLSYGCVFAPINKAQLLHNALLPYFPRLYFVDRINQQIERLSESHWYFRELPAKVERLTELRDQLIAAKGSSNAQLLAIIDDWENAPFVDNNADEETNALVSDNRRLMGVHRNIFFSSHSPAVLTSTQTLIQELKDHLQPNTTGVSLVY